MSENWQIRETKELIEKFKAAIKPSSPPSLSANLRSLEKRLLKLEQEEVDD